MARDTVSKQGKTGEQPVTRIVEAAERAGVADRYPGAEYRARAEDDAADDSIVHDPEHEELDVLRGLVRHAEQIFEHHGPMDQDPANVLQEALRSAGDDFALFGIDAHCQEDVAPPLAFRRAELRCQLALALFEYRREFGWPEDVDAEGGAS